MDLIVIENKFIEVCLEHNESQVNYFFQAYSSYIKTDLNLKDRMLSIFKQLDKINCKIEVNDSCCAGCSFGKKIKRFIVHTESDITDFAFLTYIENEVLHIQECTQNKMYQKELINKMTEGLNPEEIEKLFENITKLKNNIKKR